MQATRNEISDVGRVLIDVIEDQPGIHFRALERAANLNSAGQLRHHVDRLLRQKMIVEYEEGGYKRFFLTGDHDPQLLPRIARFARPVPRKIAKLLLVRPLSRTELRRRLGCADSTLGYHLTRMTLLGDVIKHRRCNSCHYSLADPEGVRAALHALEGDGSDEPNGGAAAVSHAPRPRVPAAGDGDHGRHPVPMTPSPADPVPSVASRHYGVRAEGAADPYDAGSPPRPVTGDGSADWRRHDRHHAPRVEADRSEDTRGRPDRRDGSGVPQLDEPARHEAAFLYGHRPGHEPARRWSRPSPEAEAYASS